MAENIAGLGKGKSWRMLTEEKEISKLDKSRMFYLILHSSRKEAVSKRGGSILRGLPTLPHVTGLNRIAKEERSSPWVTDGGTGVHCRSGEAPEQGFSKSTAYEQY